MCLLTQKLNIDFKIIKEWYWFSCIVDDSTYSLSCAAGMSGDMTEELRAIGISFPTLFTFIPG